MACLKIDETVKAVAHGKKSRASTGRWLNRNVAGMALTSFFSDFSHEMATAILPVFLAGIGASAAALGIIEGLADGASSFAKLGAGWLSEKRGVRKPIVETWYFVTVVATASFSSRAATCRPRASLLPS